MYFVCECVRVYVCVCLRVISPCAFQQYRNTPLFFSSLSLIQDDSEGRRPIQRSARWRPPILLSTRILHDLSGFPHSLLSSHISLVCSVVINVRIYIMSLYCRVFVYRYLTRRYHGYLYFFFAIYLRDNINRYSL